MSEYQSGRTSAIFSAGSTIEDLAETYQKETQNLEAMKVAFGLAGKALENYGNQLIKELSESKIPLKEAEYGKVYINRCVGVIRQMFNDTEAKRLQATGASEAMKRATTSIKKIYDEERAKLAIQEEYENDPNKDLKQRPVGVSPGNPIEEYKKETETLKEEPITQQANAESKLPKKSPWRGGLKKSPVRK